MYLHVPRAPPRVSNDSASRAVQRAGSRRPHVQCVVPRRLSEAGRQTDVGQSGEDSRVDRSGQDRAEDREDSEDSEVGAESKDR